MTTDGRSRQGALTISMLHLRFQRTSNAAQMKVYLICLWKMIIDKYLIFDLMWSTL